jgi:hypothetical protein
MLTKSKFTKDVWITGRHNGLYIIGRTYVLRNTQMVAILTELATTVDVPYSEITDLSNLTITHRKPAQRPVSEPRTVTGFVPDLIKINLN